MRLSHISVWHLKTANRPKQNGTRSSRSTRKAFPDLAKEFQQGMAGELPEGWDAGIPSFPADPKGMATRVASGKVLNAIDQKLPSLIGGSADLDPSTHTALRAMGDFENPRDEAGNLQGSAGGGWSYARTQPALWRARACAWEQSRMGWRRMAASFRSPRRSLFSRTTCGRRFGWRR